MSYSRFIESDLYIYMSSGFLYCAVCRLKEDNLDQMSAGFSAYTTQDMIEHIKQHEKAGHKVLEGIYVELLEDDLENFPNKTHTTQNPPPSSL